MRSSSESGESKSGGVSSQVVGLRSVVVRWRLEGGCSGNCGGVGGDDDGDDDEAVWASSSARSRLGGMIKGEWTSTTKFVRPPSRKGGDFLRGGLCAVRLVGMFVVGGWIIKVN